MEARGKGKRMWNGKRQGGEDVEWQKARGRGCGMARGKGTRALIEGMDKPK